MRHRTEVHESVIRAACGLLLEACVTDFLAFLTPRRVALASGAPDFKLQPVSESAVRHHFSRAGSTRALDLAALVSTLMRSVPGTLDLSPFDDAASELTTIRDLVRYQVRQPLSKNAHGSDCLRFVCFAAATSDRDAQIAAVDAINSVIADVEGYLRSAREPAVSDIEWLTMTFVYACLGNSILGRRFDRDERARELQRLVADVVIDAVLSPEVSQQVAKRPTYAATHEQLGPHRSDARDAYLAVIAAAHDVIRDATLSDYLGFLTSAAVARRASVDRKTVVGIFADPANPNTYSIDHVLNAIEHTAISLEEGGHEAGTELLWRIDALGAACSGERWKQSSRLFHDPEQYRADLQTIGRHADEALIRGMQHAEFMLISGCRTVQRVTGQEFDSEKQRELVRLAVMLFSSDAVHDTTHMQEE